jgi:NADPH-dependent 7-cyano-7-deazaguanine reductase QueF-like protein
MYGESGFSGNIQRLHTLNNQGNSDQIRPVTVETFLSNYFDVQLMGVYVPNVFLMPRPRPDIFLIDVTHAHVPGLARTIPEEMIRRYAPNYALLLDMNNGWEISRAANGEQFALNTFNAYHYDLDIFSVYRLDWLEWMDIDLPGLGNITRVAEGVYFTPESFTLNEFLWVMDSFSVELPNPVELKWQNDELSHYQQNWGAEVIQAARERTWAVEINGFGDIFHSIAPILGMFGVNTSIMEENGEAVPFFATRAYRDALIFLEDLAARDALFFHMKNHFRFPDQYQAFTNVFFRIGWASVRTQDLFQVITRSQSVDPTRRFLITPPETGTFGNRGVGLVQNSSPFNPDGNAWVIAEHVSDDTLSRILNMFDTMSFDPEVFAITAYGFYKESPFFITGYSSQHGIGFGGPPDGYSGLLSDYNRFTWVGEPYGYDSRINMLRPPVNTLYEGLFYTGIQNGIAFPRRFLGEYETVTHFAQSSPGMRLNIPPAREDVRNDFVAERARLDEVYWNTLMGEWVWESELREWDAGLVILYLADVLRGEVSVSETWDNYITSLNAYGLQAYIALFSQFPKTDQR